MRSLLSLAALSFALAASAFAETPLRPGQKTFPPVDEERLREVVTNFIDGADLPDSLDIESAVDPQIEAVWEHSKHEVEASLRRISLYFAAPGESGPLALFPVVMTMDRDGITLPRSTSGKLRSGEQAPGSITKGTKKRIGLSTGGDRFALFEIGVGKGESGRATGVIICPLPATAGAKSLNLVGAKFEPKAWAEGKMLSGLAPGVARAAIETSANIAPTREWTDRKRSTDANIALEYEPAEAFTPETGEPMDGTVGGIQATLELTNAAGYRQIIVASEAATVKSITLTPDESNEFAGHEYAKSSLVCYVMLVERRREQRYDKVAPNPK